MTIKMDVRAPTLDILRVIRPRQRARIYAFVCFVSGLVRESY